MTITFRATEFHDVCEALQHADEAGDEAITVVGRFFVVARSEAERLEAEGVAFAYLGDCVMADGRHRLVTVPVN